MPKQQIKVTVRIEIVGGTVAEASEEIQPAEELRSQDVSPLTSKIVKRLAKELQCR